MVKLWRATANFESGQMLASQYYMFEAFREKTLSESIEKLSEFSNLVANRGSVCNDFDVPIENIYKIDINNKKLFKEIGHLVDDIFENFEKHLIKFENYRNKISYKNEYQLFDKRVLEFANKMVEDIKF